MKNIKLIVIAFFLINTFVLMFTPISVKASGNTTKVMTKYVSCDDAPLGCVDDEDSVAWLLQKIFNYFKIVAPTLVILMGSLDFIKAIIASDEESMKKTEIKFVKRLIAAALIFFVALFVEIILNLCGIVGSTGGLS